MTNNTININPKEIIIVTFISIPIGFIFSFLINHKYLFRFAHKMKISKKHGDIDVWSYLMNSDEDKIEWVVIRDVKNDLMYEGWVELFSDGTEPDEIFIRDVKIYKNSTCESMYDVPGLYLSRKKENLRIEFPLLNFTEKYPRPKKEEENAKSSTVNS